MKNNINSDVNLASHTHQVPQVGFPQIEPVNKVANVNTAPMGAHALEIISAKVCLNTIEMKLHIAIME